MATAKTTKAKKPTRKAAKPTVAGSTDRRKIAELVFAGMRSGMSAFKACQNAGVNQSTFNLWLNQDAEMAAEYARAREDLIELLANETMAIADQAFEEIEEHTVDGDGKPVVLKKKVPVDVQRAKLQVDTRKWLLSKLAPKKFGDKLELSGDPDRPLAIQKIERVVVK